MAPPSASLEAWEGVATQACIQLLEVCTSHPNQKKVYTAVINKHLLLLLSQAIWPPHHPHQQAPHPSGTTPISENMAPPNRSGLQLTAAAQELLRAVVFHSSSIDGIVELAASFSTSSHEPVSLAAEKAAKVSAPRSYHFKLLQVGCLAHMQPRCFALPSVCDLRALHFDYLQPRLLVLVPRRCWTWPPGL